MIQSPRGPIEFIAHNNFTSPSPASADNIDRPRSIHIRTQRDNIDSDNQLVWSNPIRQGLKPQVIRQLAYLNTFLHMAQSANTSLGVNLFWDSGATSSIEWKQWF